MRRTRSSQWAAASMGDTSAAKIALLDLNPSQISVDYLRDNGFLKGFGLQSNRAEEQAKAVFPLFRIAAIEEQIPLDAEISAVFTNAGHILGACSITLVLEGKTLVFSGDIGRDNDVLMYPPTKPKKADSS